MLMICCFCMLLGAAPVPKDSKRPLFCEENLIGHCEFAYSDYFGWINFTKDHKCYGEIHNDYGTAMVWSGDWWIDESTIYIKEVAHTYKFFVDAKAFPFFEGHDEYANYIRIKLEY